MLFVGQGQTFQIWEPTIFEKFKMHAKKKSNINRASLKWEKHFNNNEGEQR
jgi:MraZ protein